MTVIDPRSWAAPRPSGVRRYVPILTWLPNYDRGFLRFDVIAGATVWGLLVLGWAVANDLIVANPCSRFQRHVRPRQVNRTEPRGYAGLIAVLCYTGCRLREAIGSRWTDIDSGAKLINFAGRLTWPERTSCP